MPAASPSSSARMERSRRSSRAKTRSIQRPRSAPVPRPRSQRPDPFASRCPAEGSLLRRICALARALGPLLVAAIAALGDYAFLMSQPSSTDEFGARDTLRVGDRALTFFRLDRLAGEARDLP